MLNFKNTLLCSILSVGILSASVQAHALSTERQVNINAYVELGANIGLLDEAKELNQLGKTTIKDSDFGYSGSMGIRFNNFSLGIDFSTVNSDIIYKSDMFTNGKEENLGDLDITLVMPTFTAEHSFDSHNTIYGSIAFGSATYDLEDSKGEATYSNKDTKPAFSVGLGYKLYVNHNNGLYLALGTKYTRVLISKLPIEIAPYTTGISGGLDILQLNVKVGYQF